MWSIETETIQTLRSVCGPNAIEYIDDLDKFIDAVAEAARLKQDVLNVHCPELLSISQQYAFVRILMGVRCPVRLYCFDSEPLCQLLRV